MKLIAICTLFLGKIICVSDQSGRMGAKVEDNLYLKANEVKAHVIKNYSESDVKEFLEGIPQFYKQKSTVFNDFGK